MYINFFLQTTEFKKIFYSIQSICQKRTISEITQHVYILIEEARIIFRTTDLEIFVEFQVTNFEIDIPIGFSYENVFPVSFMVNSRRLYEITKDIDSEKIQFIIKENTIGVLTEYSEIFLNTYIGESFPAKNLSIENILSLNSTEFINNISYCVSLAPSSTYQQGINSILFEIDKESFNITSTDGHCLAHSSLLKSFPFLDKKFLFCLSKKACSDIKKILEITIEEILIGKAGSEIVITGKNYFIFIKTVSEKFPDYKNIIQLDKFNKLSCKRDDFLKIVRRLSSLTAGKFIPASLSFVSNKNLVIFNLNNKEIGTAKENLNCKYDELFEDISISFYPPYLLQAASSINSNEEFDLIISNKKKPLIIKHIDKSTIMIYAIMPMISV